MCSAMMQHVERNTTCPLMGIKCAAVESKLLQIMLWVHSVKAHLGNEMHRKPFDQG